MNVAIQGFEIEFHLSEMLGLKLLHLEFKGDEALQFAMVEKQIETEIFSAHLQKILFPDEGKVAAQLDEKLPEIGDQSALEVGFGMGFGQVEKIEEVGVLEDPIHCGV